MEAIFRKVNSVLPPRYAAHMERIARVSLPLLQGGRDYARVAEPLKLIRDALLYQYRLTLSYISPGKWQTIEYRVDPYTLIFYKGGLYLLGYAHNRKALRTFAVERISRVRVEKERFEMPKEFQPEKHLKSAFGIVEENAMEVAVRFSPEIAHAVRDRLWHPTQKLKHESDGSAVISFTAGGKMEIISWVLSYGRHAELLEPADLREEVKGIVAKMAGMYGAQLR
jgi:proteasome accessory factor B